VEALLARRYDPSAAPRPEAPVARRLTRVEVARTVRDVLGVDADVDAWLPPESVALGFDNLGSAQVLAPAAVEGLLRFAEAVARDALRWDDPNLERRTRLTGGSLDGEGRGRLNSQGTVGAPHAFPRSGTYRVHVATTAEQAGPERARFRLHVADTITRDFEVASEDPFEPQLDSLEFQVLSAAQHSVEVEFLNDYYEPDDPDPSQRDRNLVVQAIEVEGPLGDPEPTAFQRELFERFPEPLGAKRLHAMLESLALRLWRRPAAPAEIDALARLSDRDAPLEARVSVALEALLASPRFHYRFEADPSSLEAQRPLDGYELASRLSYFLWSSAPDEALLARAGEGFGDDTALVAEVERMLRDPRSSALAENFAPQWLALTGLAERGGDGSATALLLSMRRETELLFDAVLREGRPARELLEADFSFVDGALAEHYGLPGEDEPFFRRVSLGRDERRGVLGHASVLTATSDPGRSSPVLRGKWILESLLGSPPPPPPDDVPPLEASGEAQTPLDLRAALAQHRADPACASCHARIDPLGFALEAYDQLGRRREGAGALDLRGELPDGASFEGLAGLSTVLASDERFVRTLLEKLAVYALGRPLNAGDRGRIARDLETLDVPTVSLAELVHRTVLAPAFRRTTRLQRP
ncbi:MAG: DUF1592 domain-containing protein, partial [Planctomycetota bacterium]